MSWINPITDIEIAVKTVHKHNPDDEQVTELLAVTDNTELGRFLSGLAEKVGALTVADVPLTPLELAALQTLVNNASDNGLVGDDEYKQVAAAV